MPNVLLLWTDQQRFDTLACYGNTALQMPHLNGLAATSTVFERAYCTSPVCTPSRGSVMSGLYAHAHGATHNNVALHADCRSFAEHVREQGDYATGYVGKWHLGDEIYAQHGFDTWHAIEDDYQRFFSPGRDQDDRSSYHHWIVDRGYRPPANDHFPRDWCCMLPERDSKPAFCAERAVDFITTQRDRNWVLSVNTLEPHHPLPGARNGLYDPASLPVAGNFCQLPEAVPLRIRMQRAGLQAKGFEHFHLRDETSWRQCMAHYWGLCSLVDAQYGRILQALRDSGAWDDTLIIFTSDHGEMMGCHALFGKGVPYEASAHIPLLMKLPGQQQQRRVAQPVSLVSLTATICDVLQDRVPEGLHGRSLRALAEGGELPGEDVLMQWRGGGPQGWTEAPAYLQDLGAPARLDAAQGCDWRGIVTPEGLKCSVTDLGEWELYDLEADPFELDNLAIQAQQRDRLAELRQRLQVAMDRVGDRDMLVPALPA